MPGDDVKHWANIGTKDGEKIFEVVVDHIWGCYDFRFRVFFEDDRDCSPGELDVVSRLNAFIPEPPQVSGSDHRV